MNRTVGGSDRTRGLSPWAPWRVAAVYAVAAGLWIVLSDQMIEFILGREPDPLTLGQTIKGLGFVLVTAAGLFAVLRRRRMVAESLRERAGRMNALAVTVLDASPLPILVIDPDGYVIHANPACETVLGYAPEAIIGTRGPFASPAQSEDYERYIARIRDGDPIQGEIIERTRADETPVTLRIWTGTARGSGGEPTALLAVFEDVTERQRLNRERDLLLDLSLALPQEETPTQALRRVAGDVVEATDFDVAAAWILDPDSELLECVGVAGGGESARVFSRHTAGKRFPPSQTLAGSVFEEGAAVTAADRGTTSAFASPEVAEETGLQLLVALPVLAGDDVIAALELGSVDPVDEEQMEVARAVAAQLGPHITRLAMLDRLSTLNQELEQRAADLQRANAELQQFAYAASHDLAEPLRTVSNFTALLVRELGEVDEDTAKLVTFVQDGVRRMRSMLDGLLEYSQLGSAPPPDQWVELNDLVGSVLADLRTVLEERQARVEVGELPRVWGNAATLQRLFLNLITNAAKFVPDDRSPEIDISAEGTDDSWVVEVTDNGVGIPPEHRQRVFEMFRRLHPQGEYEGTGVGLTLARRVAESHGGSIELMDGPDGIGTRVRVSFPRRPGERVRH